MKVRIGIITRNRATLLRKSIESALMQNYPQKEIVVVDIASDDNTPELRREFPQVVWSRVETRLDMITPKNHLMRDAAADLFFSLDDDAWFTAPDQLAAGVALMEAKPDLAVLAYDILLPGGVPSGEGNRSLPHTRPAASFVACGALLRLDPVREVGFYAPCPSIYGGGEETDLCLRLLDRDYQTEEFVGACVWHERALTGRNPGEQRRSAVCNELAYALMRCPFPSVVFMLPAKLLNLLRFHTPRGHARDVVVGASEFLRSFPKVWKDRRPVRRETYHAFRRRMHHRPDRPAKQ